MRWITAAMTILGITIMTFATPDARAQSDGSSDNATSATEQERQLDPKLPGIGDQEQEFAFSAHAMLKPLIEMSRLGTEKASDSELVDVSKQMAKQYADMVKDLEQAAQSAGVEASKGEAPHGENRLNRLEVSGDGFDLAYVIEQQGLHDKLIAIYTSEAKADESDALAKHAEQGREILTTNVDKIEQIKDRLRDARTSPTR